MYQPTCDEHLDESEFLLNGCQSTVLCDTTEHEVDIDMEEFAEVYFVGSNLSVNMDIPYIYAS